MKSSLLCLTFLLCASASFAAGDDGCARTESCAAAPTRSLLQRGLDGLASAILDDSPQSQRTGPAPSETEVLDDQSICEKNVFAPSKLCPEQCPYAAEMQDNFCHFRCVKKNECGLLQTVPNATIPDEKMHLCRHCKVEGCMTCKAGKPGDNGKELEHCVKCMPGYYVTEEGECSMKGLWVFVVITVVVVVAAIVLIYWYVCVSTKPIVNQANVDYAFETRSRSMVLHHGAAGEEPQPYPLSTNMMTTDVAGVGTMCLFRYQFAILIWATTLLLVWLGMAVFVSSDILILGNREAKSPQVLCAVIHWGRARQLELLFLKVNWLRFAYIFSFVGALIYAVQQTRLFARMNEEENTMSDFAAVLAGFQPCKGSELLEEMLKEKVGSATGTRVVGVSVAWDYDNEAKEVEEAIEHELAQLEEREAPPPHPSGSPPKLGYVNAKITDAVLKAWRVDLDAEETSPRASEEVKRMLLGMTSTSTAIVVFETEEERDNAVKAARHGLEIDGAKCTLRKEMFEPNGLEWKNFTVTPAARTCHMLVSVVMLVLACAIWTGLLYIPYAFYMSSFSYANGDEPGHFSEGIFISLVVGAQFALFITSSLGAKHARFRYKDQTQRAYTVLYNAALILNLALDICLQSYLSYLQMVGVGAHTASGKLLGSLTSYQEIFESYPMQKTIGKLLFKYCWPCTFFVPFLAEPVCMQWLPQHIGKILVGTNPRIRGDKAERALELGEMELGRYADVIFNSVLLACIPFIAPAYLHMTAITLIFSHTFIYWYDKVKVLRYVTAFTFSSPDVNVLGMQLFAIPTSMIAGALVFKENQMIAGNDLNSGLFKGWNLFYAVAGTMAVHLVVHLLCLSIITHCCAGGSDSSNDNKYADVAKVTAATYFSTNPVHCLRSKYVKQHRPPQIFYEPGKEVLMSSTNPSIGSYFVPARTGGGRKK